MRKVPLLLVLALGAAGCGDTPQAVLRDVISYRNELADEALRVTDEASAKETRDGRLKKMKDRQEWLKKRLDQVKDDNKKLHAFAKATEENSQELLASAAYLERAVGWLETVRQQGGEAPSLTGLSQEITSLANFQLPQPPPPTPKTGGTPGT